MASCLYTTSPKKHQDITPAPHPTRSGPLNATSPSQSCRVSINFHQNYPINISSILSSTTPWYHPPCSHHEPWIRWDNYRNCRRYNRAYRNNRYRLLLLPPEEEETGCGICHGVGHEHTHTHCDRNLCNTDEVEGQTKTRQCTLLKSKI